MVSIQPLKTGHRLSFVVKLTVIVILNDPGRVTICPVNDSQPSVKRERHPGRVLMRRRKVDSSGRLAQRIKTVNRDAFFIKRNRNTAKSCSVERFVCSLIGGIFNDNAVPGVHQHVGTERKRLLRTCQNDDLFCTRPCPALKIDIFRDCSPQALHTLWWTLL